MVDYVVTPNLGLAISIVARMNALMGYPNTPTKTDRYTTPLVHFADENNPGAKRHLVIIKEVWAPALNRNATVADINGELTPGELNDIKSRETLEAEGAFPPEDGGIP